MKKMLRQANSGLHSILDYQWFLFLLRLFLGGIFIIASLLKLPHQVEFIGVVSSYGILPTSLAEFYGAMLPWVELIIGVLLVLGLLSRLVSGIGMALTITFVMANVYAIGWGGESGSDLCGCFGTIIPLGHSGSLTIDGAMLLAATLLFFRGSTLFTLSRCFQSWELPFSRVTMLARVGAARFASILLIMAILIPTSSTFAAASIDSQTAPSAVLESVVGSQTSTPKEGKLVFMFFYADWCQYCQQEKPIVSDLESEYGERITFGRIDGPSNPQSMKKFDVKTYPTMILTSGSDASGQRELFRFTGFTSKETLKGSLDNYLLAKVIDGAPGQNKESADSTIDKVEGKDDAQGQNKESSDNATVNEEGIDGAPGQNKEPGDSAIGKAHIDSYAMVSLSPALHVLPPLGEDNEKITQADQTLVDFLLVTICRIDGDQCIPAYEFTSEKINSGLDYIKLQNKFYHVNWNISKADSGETFEIRFVVAGLDIGEVTYVPKKGETIPIRFGIDNNPRIRARILHEQGYSAMEIAQALIDEFDLGAYDIAQILYYENFTGTEVGEILRDLFGLDATDAAHILKDVGFPVVEVALMLKNVFGMEALEGAQILLDLGFSSTEITLALRDAFGLDAYNAGLVLKDLGFNEYTIQSMLIEVYDAYAVIVDVTSTINNDPAQGPPGYTGLAFCSDGTRSTEPYIPGLFGQFVTPSDINKGIGGDFRYVYVKYELVSKTSVQPVVTGIKAVHWPYWNVSCPAGWTAVSRLTSGTWGDCDRIGMCALYEPFKDADKFITNAAISYGDFGNPASKCSAVDGANANVWPLYTDSLDIHRGCEDEHWVFFCYNQAQASPTRPVTIEVSDNEKLALLEQYAPRVFFAPENPFIHPAERFYPSSVEWSFDHLIRYSPDDLPPSPVYHKFPSPDNKYYVTPKEWIDEPSDWLEYHYGCNGSATDNPCQLSDAPAYAFWNKQTIPWGGEGIEVVDLTYFFYFTYNRGKEYWWTVWGNHVGDWEHITVRLGWVHNPSTGWELKPLHLFVSAHDFGTSHPWDTISKVPGSDHPIVYSAEGSHGNYVTAGRQRYGKITKILPYIFLADYTGQGAQWNTWTNLETFDYDGEHGLGSSIWPRWMSTDYDAPCAPDNPGCNPYDPASGPIYRWGTYEFGSCSIECRMAKGPTGPVDKGMWNNPYVP